MVPKIKKTSDLVQEITAASEEQATGVGQINAAVNQLNTITQQNASASEQLAATAEEMSGQAEQLQQLVGFFKVEGAAEAKVVNLAAKKKASGGKGAARKALHPVSANLALASEAAPDESEFAKF
jgi:methyl-accepting chemotaxis protein